MNYELPDICDAGIAVYREKTTTKERTVTQFEIELPLKKEGVSFVNGKEMNVDTNMLICAKPGQTRHTSFPFRCYYIHLSLKDGMIYDKLMKIPDFVKTENYGTYIKIFEKINYYYNINTEAKEFILQSLVLELIFNMIHDSKNDKIQHSDNIDQTFIAEALKYIHININGELSLEAMAKRSGFSAVHFHNQFKKYTGQTLGRYVEEQRILKAINMLGQTGCTLAEIAYECGFSSQSYFNYAFKRKMGVSPRKYIPLKAYHQHHTLPVSNE